VGFDFISLTSWKFRDAGRQAHRVFLDPDGTGSPLWILEDLSLEKIDKKIGQVIVSPLFVKNGNGSPITVFAEISD
jgi:kynurenine formamidase